jgi:hypothetical protein
VSVSEPGSITYYRYSVRSGLYSWILGRTILARRHPIMMGPWLYGGAVWALGNRDQGQLCDPLDSPRRELGILWYAIGLVVV